MSISKNISGLVAALAATGLFVCAAQAQSDAVVAMCMDAGDPPAVCDCAAKALKDEIGAEDYATYEKVGAIYLDEITSGRGRADAWTAAIGQVGVSLSATNPMGKAHRNAMKACAS